MPQGRWLGSAEIAAAIRWILSMNPPYHHTREIVKDAEFKANIQPNWLFWHTEILVRLQVQNNRTRVLADTKSQWFILVDMLDFYNRYLRDFMRDIRLELQRKALQRQETKV
jgi:hypothetical protein